MKPNFLILTILLIVSAGIGFGIYRNLNVHYFIEEYYYVQNLDPNNEKDAETLRQQIQQLIQKTVPSKYRPHPDKFQCFKIISEASFFCSVDTYRKRVAEYMKKLLQETVPQEVGWISLEQAIKKADKAKQMVQMNDAEIDERKKELENLKKESSKLQKSDKTAAKTNELYKKNLELLRKKADLLQNIIAQSSSEDVKENFQVRLGETQRNVEKLQQEYKDFHDEHKALVDSTERRDSLQREMDELLRDNKTEQKTLSFVEDALRTPNAIGKVANIDEIQLISDESKRKFDVQKNRFNLIWFAVFVFGVLSNLIFRFKMPLLVSQEELTMTDKSMTNVL